ncbi:MAG: DNA-binding protein [Deltaproteobacteria bacterium]|nr:MAG: DNA-binding protein [Deltaproteobacteria bacterium]
MDGHRETRPASRLFFFPEVRLETELLTVREVARYARCNRRTVYRAVASGELRAGRKGSTHLLFDPVDVRRWVFGDSGAADSRSDSSAAEEPPPQAARMSTSSNGRRRDG